MNKAIPYYFPKIYNIFLSIWSKDFRKEYQCIAQIIGKNKKVFELGCGTALFADYLDKTCSYIGWDLNQNFVNYCQKKKIKVFKKDIFEYQDYPQSDVIVISDVLHHIVPKHKELIKQAKKRTKTLIACEPVYSYKYQKFPLYFLYDKFLGDNDGINNLKNREKWGFDNPEELKDYFRELEYKKIIFLGKNKESFIIIF